MYYTCGVLHKYSSMAHIISFSNHKGGVGKSTSALNVGQLLAERGHRVLFIDGDPQTNLTQSFHVPEGAGTLSMLLETDKAVLSELICPVGERQWLLAGSKRLQLIDKMVGGTDGVEYRLRDALEGYATYCEQVRPELAFDYIIIDTPPSLGGVTFAALLATDSVFIPVQPEYYGYSGLTELLAACARVKRNANARLTVRGIFFTKYHSTYRKSLHHQYVELIREDVAMAPLVMNVTIRENVKLGEAQALHVPMTEYAPHSNGAIDYNSLTDEILKRI